MTYLVKVIRTSENADWETTVKTVLPGIPWEEVDEETYHKLQNAIKYANSQRSDYNFFLYRHYPSDLWDEIFQNAEDFITKFQAAEDEKKKKAAQAKLKREATEKGRKLKQLEKLKKELGV